MLGTTREIFSVMPVRAKSTKRSSPITDIRSIKLLGRQLLGGAEPSLPKPFVDFLTEDRDRDAHEMFTSWDAALIASYGKRKFVRMELPGGH